MSETKHQDLPIVEDFLRYLLDERHFSPYTSRCYGVDLRQYVEFLVEEHGIRIDRQAEAETYRERQADQEAGPERANGVVGKLGPATVIGAMVEADVNVIRGFLARLDEQQYSSATVARKIATLRSFHRWLDKQGLIESNPMLLIRTPRQNKRLPKAIDVEQVEKLLAAPDDTNLLGARDRAILETLYSTGIRVSELVGINRGDVDDTGQALCRSAPTPWPPSPTTCGCSPSTSVGRACRASRTRRCSSTSTAPASRPARSAGRSASTSPRRGSTRTSAPTPCGTASPRTCSTTAPTCAPCRSCSATSRCPRRRSTRT
jgi:site-specific recombinase XerD